jgi:hypothetical protein
MPPSAETLLHDLGVTPEAIEAVGRERDPARAEALLSALKETARKSFRRLAFELHPDRNPDDPEKARLFVALTKVAEYVQALELPRPPEPVPYRVSFTMPGVGRPPSGQPSWKHVRVAGSPVDPAVAAANLGKKGR